MACCPSPAARAGSDPGLVATIGLATRAVAYAQAERDPWVMLTAARILARLSLRLGPGEVPAATCADQPAPSGAGSDEVPSLHGIVAAAVQLSGWYRPDVTAMGDAIIDAAASRTASARVPLGGGGQRLCVIRLSLGVAHTVGVASLDGRITATVLGASGTKVASAPGKAGLYRFEAGAEGVTVQLFNPDWQAGSTVIVAIAEGEP